MSGSMALSKRLDAASSWRLVCMKHCNNSLKKKPQSRLPRHSNYVTCTTPWANLKTVKLESRESRTTKSGASSDEESDEDDEDSGNTDDDKTTAMAQLRRKRGVSQRERWESEAEEEKEAVSGSDEDRDCFGENETLCYQKSNCCGCNTAGNVQTQKVIYDMILLNAM